MNKNKILIGFFSLILVLTLANFVSAGGCCFNPSDGKCSMNAEESSCASIGGEFFQSVSCSTKNCDLACCVLGSDTRYVTSRECQILSSSSGFSYPGNWQGMEETDCINLARAQEKGACVYGNEYEKDCKYQTRAECSSGEFNLNSFCTAPELNTTCKTTSKTMCYDQNVYGKDSCGNPDGLKSSCDYQAGFICDQKNNTKASCKDLNCNDAGKKNGESWCVFGNSPEAGKNINTETEGEAQVNVGSRYFVQRCINGKVETEPCADYRMETCVGGGGNESEAKCENNPWQECLAANSEEADPETGSKVNEEDCNSEYCYIFDPSRAHCVTGANGEGYCTHGDDTSKWYKAKIDGDSFTITDSSTSLSKEELPGDMTYGGKSNSLIQELHLEMCVPKVAGGLQFYSGSSSSSSSSDSSDSSSSSPSDTGSSTSSTCASGNAETSFYMDYDMGDCYRWRIKSWDNPNDYVNVPDGKWGKAGIIDLNAGDWQQDDCEENGLVATAGSFFNSATEYPALHYFSATSLKKYIYSLSNGGEGSIPDATLIQALQSRCQAIADCGGKTNWVGGSGQELKDYTFSCSSDRGDHLKCTLKYTCKPWKAPTEGDCSQCNEEKSGLPCSEYRCKSIGSCDYYEPDGIDNGYCMSSSDNTAPVIQSVTLNPTSPIKPYTPVEITLTTDEASTCKFNLNKAGAKFDDMDFDFGTGYSTEHKITLTLPGQTSGLDENTTEYSLITKDGKYTLYVRCLDPAGNGQAKAAYPVNFEVMTYPDKSPPSLSEFKPISGSRIKFNTTEKTISFTLNEPSQCKWDFQETYSIDAMRYNFSCDESIHQDPMEKYQCIGTLTNVTSVFENETNFYIRCKDQPWIANGSSITNGVNYSRNEMLHAYVYKLRASEKFYISEISPNGLFEVSSNNLNLTLIAVTSGGAFYGRANCSWRHANTTEALVNQTFTRFKITDSSNSLQIITSPYVGENDFEIKCQDEAGNEDRMNLTINLIIDGGSPFIGRLYRFANSLKIKTDEDSLCYYSFDRILNCLFDINNASLMSGLYSQEHDTNWIDDKTYYVKCQDIFGNYDRGCGKIIRTY